MSRPRALRLVVLATVVAALSSMVACSTATDATVLPPVEVIGLADGATLQMDRLEGPAVVNLWATWCAPCRRELPDFEAVHRALGDQVAFVGVNIGDRADAAQEFIDEVGVTFPQYLDELGLLNERLQTTTLPVTVIIDDAGEIALVHSGPMDAADLEAALAPVLG